MEKKIINALTSCPLFNNISEQHLIDIVEGAKYKLVKFDKKDIYILAGMPYRHVDLIVEGEMVARMVSLSGKSVEVSRLVGGDLVAPAFIFAKDNLMPVSVETEKETTVLRISKPDFVELIDINPVLRRNFITILSNIDVFLTKKMRVLSLFTVREKVGYFLKEAAGKQGSNVVQLNKSRQEIAESFGIQKFSLLRTMSELQEAGAIRVEGKRITILDRNKL